MCGGNRQFSKFKDLKITDSFATEILTWDEVWAYGGPNTSLTTHIFIDLYYLWVFYFITQLFSQKTFLIQHNIWKLITKGE